MWGGGKHRLKHETRQVCILYWKNCFVKKQHRPDKIIRQIETPSRFDSSKYICISRIPKIIILFIRAIK